MSKNGVGNDAAAKSLPLCVTLSDPIDGSPQGSTPPQESCSEMSKLSYIFVYPIYKTAPLLLT